MAKMRERGVEVVELHKLLTETVDIPKLVRGSRPQMPIITWPVIGMVLLAVGAISI